MIKLPSSIGPAGVYTACIFLPLIATMCVAMRFWVRKTRKNKLESDDWTILLGFLCMWAASGIILAGASEKFFGYHTQLDSETGEEIVTWRERRQVEFTTIVIIVHTIALGFTKLSVVLLYRRLFVVNRQFNIWSAILCVIIILWTISFFFAVLFQCGTHMSAFWTNGTLFAQYCDTESWETTIFCITDVLTDFAILLTPIPVVWKLKMSMGARLALCSVFALGILSIVAGMIRAVLTGIFELDTEYGSRDLLAANTILVVWCVIESSSAIIGACLPTVRPLFQGKSPESVVRSFKSIFSLRSNSQSSSANKSARKQGHSLEDEIELRAVSKGSQISV
ncbi:uncharacterized protein EAE98_005650 [Botrytis deweyae]|uniref:Rhodopsin domain-containing protein n=1 Tax=Botrytis deweyae TaxID=2478750 RepID=A0ABQ7IME2_9HELO|nr:uncharacterized protein EAE98_005650 [Botrytis deweyae]KAF7928594.1 hypothetical protein EAE98_005650 [Botrytis deweyae]